MQSKNSHRYTVSGAKSQTHSLGCKVTDMQLYAQSQKHIITGILSQAYYHRHYHMHTITGILSQVYCHRYTITGILSQAYYRRHTITSILSQAYYHRHTIASYPVSCNPSTEPEATLNACIHQTPHHLIPGHCPLSTPSHRTHTSLYVSRIRILTQPVTV